MPLQGKSTTWTEYVAVCLTCRRLRKQGGAFPDHPHIIACGRDRDVILAHAQQHERAYEARDEVHAIEIRVYEATLRQIKVRSLLDATTDTT